jgi:hypothetical protein
MMPIGSPLVTLKPMSTPEIVFDPGPWRTEIRLVAERPMGWRVTSSLSPDSLTLILPYLAARCQVARLLCLDIWAIAPAAAREYATLTIAPTI